MWHKTRRKVTAQGEAEWHGSNVNKILHECTPSLVKETALASALAGVVSGPISCTNSSEEKLHTEKASKLRRIYNK